MKSVYCLIVLCFYLLNCVNCDQEFDNSWNEFKLKNSRTFGHSNEETLRKKIFIKTSIEVNKHNAEFDQGLHSYRLGINQFSDRTPDELKILLGAKETKNSIPNIKVLDAPSIPQKNKRQVPSGSSLDWRQLGAVNPIKNQGSCGSCWSFSANAALESAWYRKTGKLLNLSEQQLVDCDGYDAGCNGGWPVNALLWYFYYGGSMPSSTYAYNANLYGRGTCKFSASKVAVKLTNVYKINSYNEAALQYYIKNQGVISITICVDQYTQSFYGYKSGIFTGNANCASCANHAVDIVGYGTENGKDYYIVRNSWGTSWGEAGYMRVLRNKNVCNLAYYPVFPTV